MIKKIHLQYNGVPNLNVPNVPNLNVPNLNGPNVANGIKNPSVFLKICGRVKKQRVVCGGVLERRISGPNVGPLFVK